MTGLLWFDDNPHDDIITKTERASKAYIEKYGEEPSVVYVNPVMLSGMSHPPLLSIKPMSNVLIHHFFVCKEEETEC